MTGWIGKLVLLMLVIFCSIRLAEPEPPFTQTQTARGTTVTRFARPSPAPVAFVVHSVYQDHFTCLPMARALWSAGFEAVVVEFEAGLGFGEYVVELEELARASGRERVYGVGHSMGADIVFSARGFSGRAALGFPVDVSLVEGSVMVGAGAWDQVHTRAALQQAAGNSPLVISAYCDHSQESLDPSLQRAVVEAFGGELEERAPNKVLAQGGLLLSGSILLVWLLPAGPSRPRSAAANLGALALLLANFIHPSPLLYTLALTLWLGSAWAQSGTTPPQTVRVIITNLVIICSAAGLSWALHGYQNILAEPGVLVGLPVAVLSWFPILAGRITNGLCQPQAAWPYLFTLLLLTELLLPGKLFAQIRRLTDQLYSRMTTFKFQLEVGGGKAQGIALLALLIVGSLMWAKTLSAGYSLNQGELLSLVWKLGSLVLLPILLWILVVRRVHVR